MKKLTLLCINIGTALSIILVGCRGPDTAPAQTAGENSPTTTASPTEMPPPQRGGTLVISFGLGTPRHFNPALVSGSATAIVGVQIFASPLRFDENWNPLPYLAQSWEISADGLSVTLHLVPGATFHDGVPITSDDVAFSVMTVKKYHPFKSMFDPVAFVETPDPLTAVIRLSLPHPAILLAMSPTLMPILPKHIYGDGQDIPTHPANLTPVGSGPFKLVSYEPGKTITLERYAGYFREGQPYLDKIVFQLEDDPAAQLVNLQRQETHLAPAFIDFEGLGKIELDANLAATMQGYEGLGVINWLAFNLLRPPLDEKSVRQAIAYAIDPDFIIRYLHQGRSRRATGPISPDSPFYEPEVPRYEVDLEQANRLLDQSGKPRGADGMRFSLTLDYVPIVPSQQHDIAFYLQHQLAKIGVDVQVRTSDSFPEWAERIGKWDFDMTMDTVYNWGDPVIGVDRTYVCSNIRQGAVWTNTQNYCSPRVDELLSAAGQEMDPTKRKQYYSEFQKIVADDLPIIWINIIPFFTVYNRGLGNPPLSIWGMHSPLDEVYWAKLPVRDYASVPKLTGDESQLKNAGVRAISLLQNLGLYDALDQLDEPDQGFLDMETSGLHILGITRQGTVFLDNSGQISAGIDISSILDLDGKALLDTITEAAESADGSEFQSAGVWPNPITNQVTPMAGWCGNLSQGDIVCALSWHSASGGEE